MKIGYFCYSLSGTGPSTRAADIINAVGDQTTHDVVALTSEPDKITAPVQVEPISLKDPLHLLKTTRRYFADADVVHVPINVYQVMFVRTVYWGPLVGGVGPGIQSSLFHRCLGRLLGIDKKIKVHEGDTRWEAVGYDTEVCTATIDTSQFYPYAPHERAEIREKHGFGDTDDIVLYVGKLSEGQGAHIVDEMARTTRSDSDIQFIVIGDGPMRETFENRDELIYKGFVDNKELPDYYNMADVTVAPRRDDNTSNVGLESIACGTPMITTAGGDIVSLFKDRRTYVWADRSSEDVLRTIRDLLRDPADYEAQVDRGLETMEEMQLSLSDALETHLAVYEELDNTQ